MRSQASATTERQQDAGHHRRTRLASVQQQESTETAVTGSRSWSEKWIELVEALSNFFFYLFAFFIVILPPLHWLGSLFEGREDHPVAVALAAIVFVFIVPALTPLVANQGMALLERVRKGDLLRVFFQPFRAVCAVVSIYGILALEYKVIHSHTDATLLEVFVELLKAL